MATDFSTDAKLAERLEGKPAHNVSHHGRKHSTSKTQKVLELSLGLLMQTAKERWQPHDNNDTNERF